MLNVARLANLLGYLCLVLGLALANARQALGLDPTRDVLLARAGWYLAGISAAIFLAGLVVLWIGAFAGSRRSGTMP